MSDPPDPPDEEPPDDATLRAMHADFTGDQAARRPHTAHTAPGATNAPPRGSRPVPEFSVVWDGTRDAPAGPYLGVDLEPPRGEPNERIAIDRTVVLSLLRVQPMTVEELALRLDVSLPKLQNVMYALASAGEIERIGFRRNLVRGFGQHRKGHAVYAVREGM